MSLDTTATTNTLTTYYYSTWTASNTPDGYWSGYWMRRKAATLEVEYDTLSWLCEPKGE